MPAPNNTTAQAQIAIMEQVINDTVETSQNLDEGIDRRFGKVSAMDMGKEKYRHPIQFDVGGQGGLYDPDGGPYFAGTGPEYNQFILVPQPLMIAITATELLERISRAGGLEVVDPITRMIASVKKKMAHLRNTLFQGYNQGIFATVDATYAGGATVQLKAKSFGNRLLDINNQYAVTDASGNYNIVGVPTVLNKSNSTGASIDTVTLDAAPAGLVAGSSFLIMNSTSGAPLAPQGMQYIISTSNAADMDGISRALPQIQCAGVDAAGSTLTLGLTEAERVRQLQLLGNDEVKKNRFWYGHNILQSTPRLLGFAKTTLMSTDGKLANFDMSPGRYDKWMIGDQEVETDSVAAVDTLYDVCQNNLKKVRYPGSQKFLPGPLQGYWWPHYQGGQATSTRDMLYQDSYNAYTNLPWAHGVVNNVGVNAAMSAAV